jgi:hypothetical protein
MQKSGAALQKNLHGERHTQRKPTGLEIPPNHAFLANRDYKSDQTRHKSAFKGNSAFQYRNPSEVLVLLSFNGDVIRTSIPRGWQEPPKRSLGGGV